LPFSSYDIDLVYRVDKDEPSYQRIYPLSDKALRANLKGGKIRFTAGARQPKGSARPVRGATKRKRA
jgi:hypothetical protein